MNVGISNELTYQPSIKDNELLNVNKRNTITTMTDLRWTNYNGNTVGGKNDSNADRLKIRSTYCYTYRLQIS